MEASTWTSIVEASKPALVALVYMFAATFSATLVGRLLAALIDGLARLKERVNETKYGALTKLDDYIFDALSVSVVAVKTALVDFLKRASADGKLTKEEAQQARELAYETFMASLPAEVKSELLRVASADVKAFVMARIPAVVEAMKDVERMGGSPSLDAFGAKIDSAIKDASDPQ